MTARHPDHPHNEPPAKPTRPKRKRSPRARARAHANPEEVQEGHPDWRPVGYDGIARVQFARDVHTGEQLETFMKGLREGQMVSLAAVNIGSTGSLMRRYIDREPAFARAVEEAVADGKLAYEERLRGTARARATNLDNGSDRILEVELATHVKGYEHLRRDRMKLEGKVAHEHAIVLDPSMIERLPLEQLVALREILARMEDTVDGEARELGPGE